MLGVLLLVAANLLLDPEHRLDVMADLVRDHVRLGEIARRAEALVELPEEREIEVDLVVRRAVERARRGRRRPAAALGSARERDDRGTRVLAVRFGEDPCPEILRVLAHELRELEDRVLTLRRIPLLRRLGRSEVAGREAAVRTAAADHVAAEQQHRDDRHDHTEASGPLPHRDREAASTEPAAALTAAVLHVALSLNPLPAHGPSLPRSEGHRTSRATTPDLPRQAADEPTRASSRTTPEAAEASRRRSTSGRTTRCRRRCRSGRPRTASSEGRASRRTGCRRAATAVGAKRSALPTSPLME